MERRFHYLFTLRILTINIPLHLFIYCLQSLAFDILGDAMLAMDECKGFLLEGYPSSVEQSGGFEEEVGSNYSKQFSVF